MKLSRSPEPKLKTQKNTVHEEPAWKKRRKEYYTQRRKSKLVTVLVIVGVAIVVAFLGYQVSLSWKSASTRTKKEKPVSTIASVVNKRVVHVDGKDELMVTFHVSSRDVDRKVSQKEYDTLTKGQDVKVNYTGRPEFGSVNIVSWQPVKLEE